MNSYDIIEQAVKQFWMKEYPQDVIAFFEQKYEWEEKWEMCEELVECHGDYDYNSMTFVNDFCEGQTDVKDIIIVPLSEVVDYYSENKLQR